MEHTKGPWVIKTEKANTAAGAPTESEIRSGNYVIVHLGKLYTEQQKINARLIAAAPELLEALKPFADETAFTILTSSSCSVNGKALDEARAAIAKVEGK